MKQTLSILLLAALMATSCSKSSNTPAPEKPVQSEGIAKLTIQNFVGGGKPQSVDGTGSNAQFHMIDKITSDNAGNIYILESSAIDGTYVKKIRKATPSGVVTTLFNGKYEKFANNAPVYKNTVYYINDIACDPNGKLYVVADLIDYSTTTAPGKSYLREAGTYLLNADGTLAKQSTSAGTSTAALNSWVLKYNLLNYIAADESGNVFGVVLTNSTGSGSVYRVRPGTPVLIADLDNLSNSAIYAENGSAYVNTTQGVIKLSGQQKSTIYNFNDLTDSYLFYLTGGSGQMYFYGQVYDANKQKMGYGINKVSVSGKPTTMGLIASEPLISTGTIVGNTLYFAHKTDGSVIQKTTIR